MQMGSPLWATSVYNPELNLDLGIRANAEALRAVKATHADCTDVEYTLMAAGAYNSGSGAVTGCNEFNDRARNYVNAVLGHYSSFATRGGWPNPYPSRV
jgi:hypothetical protein